MIRARLDVWGKMMKINDVKVIQEMFWKFPDLLNEK